MEKKLKKLFDYQKFAQNKHLDEIIKTTFSETVVGLNDDALFAVVGGIQEKIPKPEEEQTINNPKGQS